MVLVVGQNSVWQHTYFLGRLERGEVNRIERGMGSAAGKGANCARGLAGLGIPHLLLAYSGGLNGRKFAGSCAADGIRFMNIDISGETRVCTTLIEDDGTVTEIVEPSPDICESERISFREAFHGSIGSAGLLVIAGTAMNGEDDDCYLEYTKEAGKRRIPVLLDSYRSHAARALEGAPDILKINARELGHVSSMPAATTDQRKAACAAIRDRYEITAVIVTLGGAGAEGFSGDICLSVSAPDVDVVNTIGAGDAFSAGAAACMISSPDPPLESVLVWGTALASANCASWKPGEADSALFGKLRDRIRVIEV